MPTCSQTTRFRRTRWQWSRSGSDDGHGMSAGRLEDLFGPLADDQPLRGKGLGLYLLRRVAEAHGGRAWANSLEGKGTTFYLELPAASPDGDSARASAASGATA